MAETGRIRRLLGTARAKARQFFSEVPGALKNHLNVEELARVIVAALSAGSGVFGVLQGVVVAAGVVFPAPTDAALAATVLTTILEVLRRLPHGEKVGTLGTAPRPRG